MKDFFQDLIKSITIKSILSKPNVDKDFKLERTGWYFFVSPISGILKIKIVKQPDSIADNPDLLRFLKFRLLVIIGCDNPNDFSKMYECACDNLEILNDLQKRTIDTVVGSKVQVNSPGIYKLKLLEDTVNYVNYWKYRDRNPYYLFNGIDANVFKFYLNKLSSTIKQVDDYLNDPFYHFTYDLDGFMIYREYVDYTIIRDLKIGKTYECKVDYINRNSLVDRQLAIKQIYLPLKIEPF